MNKDCKKFDNNTFIYPKADGIYSPREFSFYYKVNNQYAVSSYYRDGEEGLMVVDEDCRLIPSASGYVNFPISVIYQNNRHYFWSEYEDGWSVKSSLTEKIPDIDGNLFACAAVVDVSNNIYLACEWMHGYMLCDILIFKYDGTSWTVFEKLNSEKNFCKRPRVVSYQDTVSVVWDGYDKGYNIYMSTYKSGSWHGEVRVTDSDSWDLKPSAVYDVKGVLWMAWLKCIDVERDGVISKTNCVMMASWDGHNIRYIPGKDSKEVLKLNLGLLPAVRYFGYHGLRRNPQVACCANGDIGLFWELQRDETENWDNVENGWFMCMFYNGSWSAPYIIQDGGNCFTIDSSAIIDNRIHYGFRGTRGVSTDIKFGSINIDELTEFKTPDYSQWNDWKPMIRKEPMKSDGLYWGDLHCHSIYSPDAEGYPDELFFYARDKANIDFCSITDNDIYGDNILTKSALRYIQTLCDCISKDAEFQAFTGFEWTYHKPDLDEPENFNHRTVIFLDDNHTIASRADLSGSDEEAFCSTLKDSDTMWHAHHGIWQIMDEKHDANVEVVSAWTNNMEDFDTVHNQLNEGYIFGFMGASDNHRFIPGHGGALTGVFANSLSKIGLKEAFQKRHNYATCGSRTIVRFSITGTDMNVYVKAKRIIDYITIICNGNIYETINVDDRLMDIQIDIQATSEKRYFYLKIKLQGKDVKFEHNLALAEGNYIYSSPIWVPHINKLILANYIL